MKSNGQVREELHGILTIEKAVGEGQLFFCEGKTDVVPRFIHLVKGCNKFLFEFIAQQGTPILTFHNTLKCSGIITTGIQSTHDTPNTGSRDIIYGYLGLFQHFKHTNMGKSFCPSTRQYQSDFRLDIPRLSKGEQGQRKQHQKNGCLLHFKVRLEDKFSN